MTGSSHKEDITTPNGYVPNNKSLKHMKQKLIELKGKMVSQHYSWLLTPFSATDRTNRSSYSG